MGKGIRWLLGFCLLFSFLTENVKAAGMDSCPSDPNKIGPGVNGCGVSDSDALLVGGWWPGSNNTQPGGMTSLTFYPNGTYVYAQNGDSANPTSIGIEYGSYTINPVTNELTVNVLIEQNGTVGFSNPPGKMSVVGIDGNNFRLDVVNGTSLNLTRVTKAGKPEVGSWWFGSNDLTPGGITTASFYPNETYIFSQNGDAANLSWVGIEYGTYSINPTTKALTTTIIYDQNGDEGLSHPFGQPNFTLDVSGNNAVFSDMHGSSTLQRVAPIFPAKIGAYSQGSWYLDINNNGTWEPGSDLYGYFGAAGMTPVAGDWNGNGYTKAGAYSSGTWYLDLNANGFWDGAPTDQIVANFGGAPGDIPVAGDWNGNGTTKIGIYRPSTHAWYLDYDGNFSYDPAVDTAATFGFDGAIPVVGDWNGDGRDKIGVYSNGQWYLDTNGNFTWDGAGIDTFVANYGFAGALPVVGDWTGSGIARLGVYYNGDWYLDTNDNGGWDPGIDKYMGTFGSPGMVPMVGHYFDTTAVIVHTITPVTQATLTVIGLPSSAYFGQTGIAAGTNGGSGTGAISFSSGSSTACTVNTSTGAVSITSGTGSCSITASKAADTNYTATTSAAAAITTITPAAQATLTVTGLPSSATLGQAGITAGATGGSGTGAISFSSGTSTACTVSSSTGAVAITSGSGTCSITASKAADTNYNTTISAAASITITAGGSGGSFLISSSSIEVNDSGSTATFTVALGSQPTASVTIPVSSSNTSEGTVSPASLTFTNSNWATPQTVTVTGAIKTTDTGNTTFTIVLGAATSVDTNYSGIDPTDVTATNVNLMKVYSVTPAISAGAAHNLVLANDGSVWGWGTCSAGQLDTGTACATTSTYFYLPQKLNIDKAAAVSAGTDFSAIVRKDGTVWTSGVNTYNQLGHTSVASTNYPSAGSSALSQVGGITDVKTVKLGALHALSLKNDGTVWTWGKGSTGALGNGLSTSKQLVPVQAVGGVLGATITTLAAGSDFSLALDNNGSMYSWGAAGNGQVGNGTTTPNVLSPTAISTLSGVIAIGAGLAQSYAIGTSTQQTFSWGFNKDSQLGYNDYTLIQPSPFPVSYLAGSLLPSKIDGDNYHAVALVSGNVYTWGDNEHTNNGIETNNGSGDLGNNTTIDSPEPTIAFMSGPGPAMDVDAGTNYTMVLFTDGSVQTSGINTAAQLGSKEVSLGVNSYTAAPVYVKDPGDLGTAGSKNFSAYRPILAGYPATSSTSTTATVAVCPATLVAPANCGSITYYKYSTTGADSGWSAAIPITTPINLTGLAKGQVNVWVKGMSNASTELQTANSAVKVAWTVN